MLADTFHSTAKTRRRRAGSRYRHIEAFSAAVSTQPFSPDISEIAYPCDIFMVIEKLSLTKNCFLLMAKSTLFSACF